MGSQGEVNEEKAQELRAEAIRKHLTGQFKDLKSLRHDSSPILVLETCLDMRLSVLKARQSLEALKEATNIKQASLHQESVERAISRLIARADLFSATKAKEYEAAEAYVAFEGDKPSITLLDKLLSRNRKYCNELSNVLTLRDLSKTVFKAYGAARFDYQKAEKDARQKAIAAFKSFSSLAASSGVQGVGDIPAQLQSQCFGVLSAPTKTTLRKAWAELTTAFGTVSSQIPPPNAHPMVSKLSASLDSLQRHWNEFVRARVAEENRHRAGLRVMENFSQEADQTIERIAKLERSVVSTIARHRAGAKGAADEFTEELLSAMKTLPAEAMITSEAGLALAVHFEKRQWAVVYDQQLQDLTFMTVLFAFGVVLALGLSFMLYKDVNHPVEILKNSLNNLSMGGEKRRINLKFQNEFGSLIEAYNRYLDNLTSTSKRLVECPSCRNPYEMGDSFCRQCGRKLRFDS